MVIVFAWELGEGLNHIAAIYPLAHALSKRGHELIVIGRDLEQFRHFSFSDAIKCLSSPYWVPEEIEIPAACSYPEILLANGYHKAESLLPLLRQWRELLCGLDADLLIAEHAPTALLAARGLPCAKALLGTGFYCPPAAAPLPLFRTWEKIAADRLIKSEQQVLRVINQAMSILAIKPLSVLAELFRVDENFLCTWPELDHYPQRKGARYWGPSIMLDRGIYPQWPAVAGKKVFAYIDGDWPDLILLLQVLSKQEFAVLLYLNRMPALQIGVNVTVSNEPFKLDVLMEQADLVICHGNFGTVCAALAAGKPVLTLPLYAEQQITGMRVKTVGAGINALWQDRPDYSRLIYILLNNESYSKCAHKLAKQHGPLDPIRHTNRIVDRCESLLINENRSSSKQ